MDWKYNINHLKINGEQFTMSIYNIKLTFVTKEKKTDGSRNG